MQSRINKIKDYMRLIDFKVREVDVPDGAIIKLQEVIPCPSAISDLESTKPKYKEYVKTIIQYGDKENPIKETIYVNRENVDEVFPVLNSIITSVTKLQEDKIRLLKEELQKIKDILKKLI